MTIVRIDAERLTVQVRGLDVLWAFKRQITVPVSHLVGAHTDETLRSEGPWLGAGYTNALLGYAVAAGPMLVRGHREFWDVHDPDGAIVIDLRDDSYERLVVEVEDPEGTVAAVNAAVLRGGEKREVQKVSAGA
jgi:hypothetical protein